MKSFAIKIAFVFLAAWAALPAFSADARQVVDSVMQQAGNAPNSVNVIISEISRAASEAQTPADKRALLVFLGQVQENAGQYIAAVRSYAQAAGIAAPQARAMPRITSEQLVIDAVRCALSAGDWITADSYLKSAVKDSQSPEILAYIKLYSAWALLAKAESQNDLAGAIALLDSYTADPSMNTVMPAVLLTLWYINPTDTRRQNLVAAYPASPEAAVAQGKAELVPSPFWYFLPNRRQSAASPQAQVAPSPDQASPWSASPSVPAPAAAGGGLLQLGLFRSKDNAERFSLRVREAGFAPSITPSARSGGEYFVVTVPNVPGENTSLRLKTAGFESFPLNP